MSLASTLTAVELAYWNYLSTRYLAEHAIPRAPYKAQRLADDQLAIFIEEDRATLAAGPREGYEQEFHWAEVRAARRATHPDEWLEFHGLDAWGEVDRRLAQPAQKAA